MFRTFIVAIVASCITAFVTTSLVLGLGGARVPLPSGFSQGTGGLLMPRTVTREESSITQAVERAEPAVVSVIVTKDLPVIERYYDQEPNDFFGIPFQIPRYRQNGTQEQEVGGGTAFFVRSDGLLLTNKHVVADAEAEYTVLLNDGRKLPATVVARDPSNDIALLKVEGEDFPVLELSSDIPVLGQTVIAIGNALGEFRNTVSVGVVSGLKRSITAGASGEAQEELESIIQTDAAINRGNSGGPLLNSLGQVVGMNTAVAAEAQNIGFAMPAGDLRRSLGSFEKYGRIVQAFLGIRYRLINEAIAEKNNLAYPYGALVVRGTNPEDLAVIPGSPADKAGIVENDIILEADGEKVGTDRTLSGIISRKSPGDSLVLKVFSKEKEKTVTVTLEEKRE